MDKLREILVDLLNPEKAAAATARMKVAYSFLVVNLKLAFRKLRVTKACFPI